MNTLSRTLLNNAHIPSLIIGCGAVLAGLTASVVRGGISLFPALLTMLFAILLQISANLYHGYFDMRYGAGENIEAHAATRDFRVSNSSRIQLMRIVANGFALLAITCALPLFTFIGWIGVIYFLIIVIILFFYFAGPAPLVRRRWSVIGTFLLFGPIAVSGTALIQNSSNQDLLPIVIYSLINGLMAVNAHIAVQFMRYEEDRNNGKETLVTAFGGKVARYIYLANDAMVCAILIIRPTAVDFVSPWVGIILGVCLLLSSLYVFFKMKADPSHISPMVRRVTMDQYIAVIIVMMAIVLYAFDDFKISFFQLG